jgi:hypothetical protein
MGVPLTQCKPQERNSFDNRSSQSLKADPKAKMMRESERKAGRFSLSHTRTIRLVVPEDSLRAEEMKNKKELCKQEAQR